MQATAAAKLAHSRLAVSLATTPAEVEETQRLRYRVFAEEMGAALHVALAGLDVDHYDSFCEHMLVRDLDTGEVVASTRILTKEQALRAEGFYSSSEFELGNIPRLPGRMMEIGRTCVHPDYRNGATIATLWSGLGQYITAGNFDYVMGCASIGLEDGGAEAAAIMERLRNDYMAADHLRVRPKLPLPPVAPAAGSPRMPPLLKAYLSLGARICGEACWDPDFRVADVFVLFDLRNLSPRYARHFLAPSRRPQLVAA